MSDKVTRRDLIGGGALALAGITGGRVINPSRGTRPLSTAMLTSDATDVPSPQEIASFGWEVSDIHNDGADVYFEVLADIVVTVADIDVATMITGLPTSPGFEEVLCQAAVSRGGPPKFSSPPQVYLSQPMSPNFGDLTIYNPTGLSIAADGHPYQDKFFSVILKSWVPSDGTASSTARHVTATPNLALDRGDYLAFHMDHAGVQVDVEMQAVLAYLP